MKRNKRKCKRGCCIWLLTLLLCVCGSTSAVSAAGQGTLRVCFQGRSETEDGLPVEQSVNLKGASFAVYKAGVYKNGAWELTEAFAGSGVSLADTSSAGLRTAAEALYAFVRESGLRGEPATTGDDGYAQFDGLEDGLYLVVQTEELAYGDGVFCSLPSLAAVPLDTETGPLYEVLVEPKAEWIKSTPEPQGTVSPGDRTLAPSEEPTGDPGSTTPSGSGSGAAQPKSSKAPDSSGTDAKDQHGKQVKTGDESHPLRYAALAAASGAVIVCLWSRRRKRTRV